MTAAALVATAWNSLPTLGKAVAAPIGTGLALELSRQVLPIPDRWAVNKIMRFYGNLPWMTESFANKIVDVADRLKVDPFALTNLMYFESGLNPQAVNPRSGATGLIQFMPRTAQGLGTSTAAIRSMSPEQQLDWVEVYLDRVQKRHGKLKKPRDLMLAVFYPAFIGKASWRLFPWPVRRANPGIVTPWDYENLVRSRAKMPMRAILL